jgi:hypothetical protein
MMCRQVLCRVEADVTALTGPLQLQPISWHAVCTCLFKRLQASAAAAAATAAAAMLCSPCVPIAAVPELSWRADGGGWSRQQVR